MIKACVFDMDGTVSNTIHSITHFANAALKKYGLNGFTPKEYQYMVGNGAAILVRRMVEGNHCTDEEVYRKVLQEYNTTYDADFLYLTEPYDGILPLLDALRERVLEAQPRHDLLRHFRGNGGVSVKVSDAVCILCKAFWLAKIV